MEVPMHRTHQSRYELRRPGLIRVPTRETMTFAYWMLIAAAMMPYLTVALAKSAGGIDNRAPRPSLERLSGWRQRADWAHRNHFEAFPPFASAVFLAIRRLAPSIYTFWRGSPVVVAFPDCFTRLGGSECVNSASMGAWE